MPILTLTTKAADKLWTDPGERPSDKVCTFYSPLQEVEIVCIDDEMEEFETDCEIALTEDIISDPTDAERFIAWLTEHYKLKKRS